MNSRCSVVILRSKALSGPERFPLPSRPSGPRRGGGTRSHSPTFQHLAHVRDVCDVRKWMDWTEIPADRIQMTIWTALVRANIAQTTTDEVRARASLDRSACCACPIRYNATRVSLVPQAVFQTTTKRVRPQWGFHDIRYLCVQGGRSVHEPTPLPTDWQFRLVRRDVCGDVGHC